MAGENGEAITLEAEVKGRVPRAVLDAVDALVKQRREKDAGISRATILREALTEYFRTHPPQTEPAEVAR